MRPGRDWRAGGSGSRGQQSDLIRFTVPGSAAERSEQWPPSAKLNQPGPELCHSAALADRGNQTRLANLSGVIADILCI